MTKLETILLITMGIVYLVNFIGIIEIKRKEEEGLRNV